MPNKYLIITWINTSFDALSFATKVANVLNSEYNGNGRTPKTASFDHLNSMMKSVR